MLARAQSTLSWRSTVVYPTLRCFVFVHVELSMENEGSSNVHTVDVCDAQLKTSVSG
jgi:hypothetical protein